MTEAETLLRGYLAWLLAVCSLPVKADVHRNTRVVSALGHTLELLLGRYGRSCWGVLARTVN
jgi:hypothetical protein